MISKGGLITEESFTSVFPEMNDPSVQGIVIAAFELGGLGGSSIVSRSGRPLGKKSDCLARYVLHAGWRCSPV